MTKYLTTLFFCFICLASYSQVTTLPKIDNTREDEAYWSNWKNDLYDVGIKLQKDSIKVNAEAKKIMHDSAYRNLLFPSQYTWAKATELLSRLELKKASWFFIKLYIADSANKQMVLQSLIPFDKALEMDKVLISSFYTYALLDPATSVFKNNKVMITRPDVLEKEFSKVKEMIGYIRANRSLPYKENIPNTKR